MYGYAYGLFETSISGTFFHLSAPPPLPNISDQLAIIITKALQKNAIDRYQTATEMLAALQPLSTHARPLPSGCKYHLRRFIFVFSALLFWQEERHNHQ